MRRHDRDRERGAKSWAAGAMPVPVAALAGPASPRLPAPRRERRRLGRLLVGSALLHLLVAALAILASLLWRTPPEPLPPPSVEILFAPAPGPDRRPSGPEGAPHAAAMPAPVPEPVPSPVARPAPMPVPPPVPPAPRVEAPHAEAPLPAPPVVSLQAPDAATFGAPPPPVPLPVPPPPLPPAPARPAARPGASAFAHPMDLSLRPAAPAGHGLDLSFTGSNVQHALHSLTEVRSDQVGQDWMTLFSRWLDAHASYPEAAGEAGQQGTVRVRFLVARDGTVRGVQLVQSARSPWLDMAPAAWLRGARLPPLPPGTKDGEATVDLTIHFVIVGH